MSHKHAPLFATLALVQSTGGAYTRDVTFSLANTPSLDREMFSNSVDAGFVPVLPFHHGDGLEPDCVGVSTRGGGRVSAKREAESLAAPDASSRLTSFSIEGQRSRVLPQSSWRVHCCCGRSALTVDTCITVDSRVA